VEIHAGARRTEERLLGLLDELHREARADPSLLGRPVRVVVPSRSLRLHVSERIAAELGAVAGVAVQTLHGLALEVLSRARRVDGRVDGGADGSAGGGEPLVEILARRAARAERPLREAFEPYRDGYRSVLGGVRDLLDAGFEPEQAEAALECLTEARGPKGPQDELARARSVVRCAAAVGTELRQRGAAGRAHLLAAASEALEADFAQAGPAADFNGMLPTRALVVHGFADVTGRGADLIETLVRGTGGRVLIDRPPDPLEPTETDPGSAFTERLVDRLRSTAGNPDERGPTPEPSAFHTFRAEGAAAEVREVGRRLRAVLAAGARPERCAVVARDLTPFAAAVRVQFTRLGLPFSGLGAEAPQDGATRRLEALIALLEGGADAAADRWLDALLWFDVEEPDKQERVRRRPSEELRLGLRMRGGLRLGQVPEVDFEGDALSLPLGRGVGRLESAAPESGEPGRFVGFRAKLRRPELVGAQRAAKAALGRLARWPARATLEAHVHELDRLRSRELGWRAGELEEQRARAALSGLLEGLAAEELERHEFLLLATGALRAASGAKLAGAGGGVQVLDAMEARGRTFEHLFLIGLQRDTFPRPVREDPILGDDLRSALAVLLPEMPVKARGRDEERYLFAQLASSSPEVTLSWQVADEDGRPRVVSPLVVRVLGVRGEEHVEQVAAIHDPSTSGPRTAHEAAVVGGLEQRLTGHRERLAAALDEAGREVASAPVRTAVLAAFERGPFEPAAVLPWLGLLGPQEADQVRPDPRREPFYVTRFESLARCPWQTVLTRYLRLEPPPDPFEELPSVQSRVVGNVVHVALERIVEGAGVPVGGSLNDALGREGQTVERPTPDALGALVHDATLRELRRECEPAAGHVRLVAACAERLLERALDFLSSEAGRFEDVRVLGAEVEGRARVECAAGTLAIDFKADRVERREGRVVVSDYKTGRPKSAGDAATELAAGLALQPAAYARAAAEGPDGDAGARGRYLYFKAEPEETDVGTPAEHSAPFEQAVSTLVEAWAAGTFFPRLAEPRTEKEPITCSWCDVSAACLRGDSGVRKAWLALVGEGGDGGEAPPAMHALHRLHPNETAPPKGRGRRS
jgi:RecB family exonuclease